MFKKTYHKVPTVNLIKTFESFEEAYTEITKFIPEIKAYCGDSPMLEAVVSAMMNSISKNLPSTSNPNYPNTLAFSIDSKEVGLKTDSDLALGWREVFNKQTAKIEYKFRITFIAMPTFRKIIVDSMKADNWREIDPSAVKQSRFWNSVEGKKVFTKSYNKDEEAEKDNTVTDKTQQPEAELAEQESPQDE